MIGESIGIVSYTVETLPALKKAADFAAVYQVRTGFHGATDLSPIATAAAPPFDVAFHSFGIQKHMPLTALTD